MIGNVIFYSNFIILVQNRLSKESPYTLKGKVTERDQSIDALAGLSEHDFQQFQGYPFTVNVIVRIVQKALVYAV